MFCIVVRPVLIVDEPAIRCEWRARARAKGVGLNGCAACFGLD